MRLKLVYNPVSMKLDLVPADEILSWREAVGTFNDLPLVGNLKGDARIVSDTMHLYIWDNAWIDEGVSQGIDWTNITNRPKFDEYLKCFLMNNH